jgi:MscS family membrane protein
MNIEEQLTLLISEFLTVWNHGFMGVNVGRILVALLILGFFMLLRGLFSKYILYRLQAWSSKSESNIDDRIVKALIPPIRFIPIIIGVFFAGQSLMLTGDLAYFFSRLVRSLIAFNIFWALHRAAEPISRSFKKLERMLTRAMVHWVFRTIKVLLIFIAGAVILEIWGIAVGPLLAGLGLFGAAIALGAQDLFKNLIGGLTILAEKRFSPGEWIMVENVVEGIVEDIGFRSTRIRRFDKAPVHVPNANLSDTAVINFSRMTYRRIRWTIGVEYDTTVDQLRTICQSIKDHIMENDTFAHGDDAMVSVYVDSFAPSSIDILVNCFTKSIALQDWLNAKQELAFVIKDIVENKAKAKFAFPSQTVNIEKFPDSALEIFALLETKPGTKAAGKKKA